MLIGLSGYAQSGKDSLAGFLRDDHGFETRSFADPLKALLYAVDPLLAPAPDTPLNSVQISWMVDRVGWEETKAAYSLSPFGARAYLQRLGAGARDIFGEDFWVDALFGTVSEYAHTVITDCRYPNEAQAVKERGGYMIRIERPGTGPANAHASENALDTFPFDGYVNNDTDLLGLRHSAGVLVRAL